jgi:probable HAF family extracellular repeat protein
VKFGSVNATNFTAGSSTTQLTATAPPGTAGTVDITVGTIGGISQTKAADQFTYVPAPSVNTVSPNYGPSSGGTSVNIIGANLAGATAVKFGSTSASSFTVNSSNDVTATAPAGSGMVDVTVTTPGGTNATGPVDLFTYVLAPAVTGISPFSGPSSGGTMVTLTGYNFSGASAVFFGTTRAPGFAATFNEIVVTAPAGSGTVDITVVTAGGTSTTTSLDLFTYLLAPAVTGLSPASGPVAGGTSVTITGQNLSNLLGVNFGTTGASTYTLNSATQITATVPTGSGVVDVTVTTAGGTSATSAADQYTYAQLPAVTAISPSAGPTYGGNSVIVVGSNFTGATTVRFGSQNAVSYRVVASNLISAIAPPLCSGAVDVTVTSPGGTSATSPVDQYSYGAAQNKLTDVQLEVDEALGTTGPTNDVNGDGVVNAADIQIVIAGLLNPGCAPGAQPGPASQTQPQNAAIGLFVSPGDGRTERRGSIVDLGTLGGSTSRAYGIDNFGRVVGESETASSVGHAFLWQSDHMADLGLMVGASDLASVAYGISDAGQVAGFHVLTAEENTGFLYGRDSPVPLRNLPDGQPRAVNFYGQAVGGSSGARAPESHAMLWPGGAAVDLGTFGGRAAHALAINGLGQVVGTAALPGDFASHAFFYAGSGLADLGTLGGANSAALGINDVGQIVGVAQTVAGSRHAVSFDGGRITDLGTLGGVESQASGVNNRGLIVGWAVASDGRPHAFVWSAGRMMDLNGLGSLPENAVLEEATAINDLGQIVCNGSNGRAYLVTLPENILIH